jgi:hypothetical protein
MNKATAIITLYQNVARVENNEKAYDADGNEVAYDKAAVQAYVDANAYKDLRAAAYPSFADQFDTIFHEGIDAWKAQIQAVKDRFPKE